MPTESDSSRATARVFAVMEHLSAAPVPMTNLQMAQALRVPVSSMHRLLRKLCALGYVHFDADDARYSLAWRLSDLGRRLADLGGYSPALHSSMSELRRVIGATVTFWVPSGAHVRLSALFRGQVRGRSSHSPGELREPFSTPGLAIATSYSTLQLRQLTALARRRNVPFGRNLRTMRDVTRAVEPVKRRGYAVGFNLVADGWGLMSWPIPVTLSPRRFGALAVALPVSELRQRQDELLPVVERQMAIYAKALDVYSRSGR
ncbi:MAG: helix-turn-helix domain-containing protein [Nevskiaceae bacterium]